MFKKIILVIVFALCVSVAVTAEEAQKEPQKKVVIKTVSGEVSGISSNFIAILYGQDEKTSYETALAIDKDTKVEHKKSLKEIGPADTVSVKYEETTQTYKEQTGTDKEKEVTRVLNRLAKVITFIKSAPKELQALEEEGLPAPEQPEEGE